MLTRVAKSLMLHWSQMAPLHNVQHNSIEVEPSEMARSWIKASLTHANLLIIETRPMIQKTFICAQLSLA